MRELLGEIPHIGQVNRSDYSSVFDVENMSEICKSADFREIKRHLDWFCKTIAIAPTALPKGYSLGLENHFSKQAGLASKGLQFVIRDSIGNTIGGIGFRIGLPVKVIDIQHIGGTAQRDFYKHTGAPVYKVLVDTLRSFTNEHLTIKSLSNQPVHKIIFAPAVLKKAHKFIVPAEKPARVRKSAQRVRPAAKRTRPR
jgi:hypothetical protein